MSIRYSISPRIDNAHPEQREAPDFDAFVDDICADRPLRKGERYVCGPMKVNGDGRAHRSKESAEPSSIVMLDCDDLLPEQVPKLKAYFGQVESLIHHTASSTPNKPRVRALVHTNRPITRSEYILLSARIGRDLASMGIAIDPSQSRPEQPAFTPLVGAEVWRSQGPPLRVDEILEDGEPAQSSNVVALHQPIPAGARNSELTSLAGTMRKRGMSEGAIEAALLADNDERCTPPLDRKEVRRIARSVSRYPTGYLPHPSESNSSDLPRLPASLDLRALAATTAKPSEFLMHGIPIGYATLFSGHGGVGKTTLVTQVAVCTVTAIDFCGLPVQQRKVLFLSCEDRADVIHLRLERVCRYLNVDLASLTDRLHVMDLVGHDTILFDPNRRDSPFTPMFHAIRKLIEELGIEVLFVDGVSDTFGGNEIDRGQVKRYVNALVSLIPPTRGAVILIGHVDKVTAKNAATTEGYSGSTAWNNAVRARWYLRPDSIKDATP